jgi:Ca2+-binding EF-hand superfamily protein
MVNKTASAGFGRSFSRATMIEPNLSDIWSKLRCYIKTSCKTLEEVFKKVDLDNQGVITNLEFKEAVRKLHIGFTSKEIDLMIKNIQPMADNKINYLEFMGKFKERYPLQNFALKI